MSTTTIQFNLNTSETVTGVKFNNPTSTFGVKRTDTGDIVVAAGVALTSMGSGLYEYAITDPAPNLTYNYWVQFSVGSETFQSEFNITASYSSSWHYTTPQQVTDLCGVPVGNLKDEWIQEVEDLIDRRVRTTFTGTTVYTDEMHSGDPSIVGVGSAILFVKHPPIVSVSSLTVNSGSIASSQYKVFPYYLQLITGMWREVFGALYKPNTFPEGVGNILISYTGGSSTVPPKVRLCAKQMVATIALVAAHQGSDLSMKYSRVTETSGDTQTMSEKLGLQSSLNSIMNAYLSAGVLIR
jgi:hypothetical protein